MNQRGFALPALLLKGVPGWIGYAVIAAAAVAFVLFIDNGGYQRGKAELTEYIAKQATATLAAQKVVEKIVTRTEIEYRDRIRVIKEKGDTVVREVPIYVTKEDDSACELRAGFVRVHDAAAAGAGAPGGATESDRTAGGVALSEALSVVADNYKTCRIWREQVIGWQEYYRSLQAQVGGHE